MAREKAASRGKGWIGWDDHNSKCRVQSVEGRGKREEGRGERTGVGERESGGGPRVGDLAKRQNLKLI